MIRPDPELERLTLKLRDAFRVFAWQMYKTSYPSQNPNDVYCKFYTLWNRSRVAEMDFFRLKTLAIDKGFTVEEMLTIRVRYYGLEVKA